MVNFDEMVSENFVFTLRNDEFKHERFKNKLIQSIPSNLTKTPQFPPIYQNPSPQQYINKNHFTMNNKVFPAHFVPEPTKDGIQFAEISHQQLNVPQATYEQKQNIQSANTANANAGSTGGSLLAKKKIVVAAVVGFVVIVGVVVGVVVGLNAKKNSTTAPEDNTNYVEPDPTPPSPSPPPQTVTSCADVPSQCAGVPLGVSNYIFDTYNNDDQIRSLLQVSRTLTGLTPNSTTQELVTSYRDILRSAECLAYTLGSNYTSAYQDLIALQMTDQNAVETYLSMNQAFTGEPIRLTATDELINTCQFNVTTPSARRRLQSSQNCSSTEATSVLIYFDGIGYSPSSTVQNLREIQTALESHPNASFNGGSVALGALRNQGQGNFFQDLVSSFQQHQNSSGRSSSNSSDLYRSLQLILDLNTNSSRIPHGFSESQYLNFNTFFRTSSIQSFLNNASQYNLNRHRDFVRQQIQEGKKVVFVAHGQSTIYANIIYNLLSATQKQSVSEVFIAPFANSMADNSNSYISHDSDHAVSEVRRESSNSSNRLSAPMNSNANGSHFNSRQNSEENHGMRDYMEAYRQTIVQLIVSARLRISQPSRTLGSGPITVALSWDSQPDLDLHIFEPNYHVYYPSRQGHNGYLDLDDTNGYGPEHYYTNCSIETGNYTFKVNYYWGSAPSSATVTVSAGPEYYTKQLVLQTARQSSGNADPEYSICTVNVGRSSLTDSYIFTIYPL